jgi:chemotaxis family two-component system response regulator Rcp1
LELKPKNINILLVEDNPADVRLIREAFKDNKTKNDFHVEQDGEAAIKYLNSVDGNSDGNGNDNGNIRPDLIILDLNLPKKNGFEVLEQIKTNPSLKSIPVVVLSTSDSEEHIYRSYNLNANCYITKPVEFNKFLEVVRVIESFWFEIAKLPSVN